MRYKFLFFVWSEKFSLRSDLDLIKNFKKLKILYISNFDKYIKLSKFKKMENNWRLFLIILVKFWISVYSTIYLKEPNSVKF